MHDAVSKLEDAVLAAIARHDLVNAHALQLLLRRYASGAYPDQGVQDAIGRALAAALESYRREQTVAGRAAWIELFVDAAALSEDERLIEAIAALARDLRRSWAAGSLGDRCAAIAGCLYAARLEAFRSTAAGAVDELERTVGRAYEPGERLGSFTDQVRAASALLVAYRLTGRLPYSMLAEELMRSRLNAEIGDLETACEAARVLCRLAALHDDDTYRASAVIAPGADYRADAARLLQVYGSEAERCGVAGAIYGLAQLELESGRF